MTPGLTTRPGDPLLAAHESAPGSQPAAPSCRKLNRLFTKSEEFSLARGSDFLPCFNDLSRDCGGTPHPSSVPTISSSHLGLSAYLGRKLVSCLLNLRTSSRLHLWLNRVPSSVSGDKRPPLQLEPSRRRVVEKRGLSVMRTNSTFLQQMNF